MVSITVATLVGFAVAVATFIVGFFVGQRYALKQRQD
jgi:hypothetical protein